MHRAGAFDKSNALINRKFTYKEEYGNGLLLTFAWVKDGKFYTHQATIERPLPNKKLTLKWETFRDRLTPGQQEEWRLTVTNPDGTPADAQLMAAMYDKSLDQLYRHNWSFAPYMYIPTPSTNWSASSWGRLWASTQLDWTPRQVKQMKFSRFDFNGFSSLNMPYWWDGDDADALYDNAVVGYATAGGARRTRANDMMMASMPMAVEESAMMEKTVVAEDVAGEDEPQDDGQAVQMRENLNETAFFYPALTTDAKGRVAIKFTLPESLTTWRFMGIATTQDMNNGFIEGETVAQKEVMIQPNMPRFLRQGDKATASGTHLQYRRPCRQRPAASSSSTPRRKKVVIEQQQPFSVEGAETAQRQTSTSSPTTHQPLNPHLLLICQVIGHGRRLLRRRTALPAHAAQPRARDRHGALHPA